MPSSRWLRQSLAILVALVTLALTTASPTAEEPFELGPYRTTTLLHRDDFDSDLSQWQVEQQPGGTVKLVDGQLVIEDRAGCTVWFKTELEAPVLVEFDVTMIKAGGPFDRTSDLNTFIMAEDPNNPDLLAGGERRRGKFSNYHGLRLYYVGYGANNNQTARFRRYTGDGKRPLRPEYDLKASHQPNTSRRVRILVADGVYQFWIDDERVIHFEDEAPYLDGWFGFRTVKNHMAIDRFRIWRVTRAE